MAYGLKYFFNFDCKGETLTVNFEFKDFGGLPREILASGVPVVHKWFTDDINEPIRGSSLELGILTEGGTKIEDFYTEEDNGVIVTLLQGTNKLFAGFLVQDDFTEPINEYLHEFTLSATDGLGILKDVAFDDANKLFGTASPVYPQTVQINNTLTSNGHQIILYDNTHVPAVGQTIIITGTGTAADGMPYTIASVAVSPPGIYISVLEFIPVDGYFPVGAAAQFIGVTDITQKISLGKCFSILLSATGLQLDAHVYMNIRHNLGTYADMLNETYIRPKDFITGDQYRNSYDILQGILQSLKACIFQAAGVWHIIRQDEHRYTFFNAGVFRYSIYNYKFELQSIPNQFDKFITIGGVDGEGKGDLLADPDKTVQRPYKFSRGTFEYNQAPKLLYNSDLQILGALLGTVTTGSGPTTQTLRDYAASGWANGFIYSPGYAPGSPASSARIRVVTDINNNELDRFLVVSSTNGDQARAVVGTYIEANAGDSIGLSVSFRTNSGVSAAVNFVIELQNSPLPNTPPSARVQVRNGGFWASGATPPIFNVPNDAVGNFSSASVTSFTMPFTGRIYVFMPNLGTGTHETHFKDIQFTYTPRIAGQKDVKGHVHTNRQASFLRSNDEKDLFVDDALSNNIQGVLFQKPVAGELITGLTSKWDRLGYTEARKLGDLITAELLQERNVTRIKIEGDCFDLKRTYYLSPIDQISCPRFPDYKFLFGNLELNYKTNRARFTMYELFKVGEDQVITNYEFRYLYE